MPKLIPIVEGYGEVGAVPLLIRRYLQEVLGVFDVDVGRAKNALGNGNLQERSDVQRFLNLAFADPDCAGVMVIRDADDHCASALAKDLASFARDLNPKIPIAVVCAKCEYEAWFLASLYTIRGRPLAGSSNASARPGLPEDAVYDGDVECEPAPKGWIDRQLGESTCYKETSDQEKMTAWLDIDEAKRRSRSFRRFCHAVEQLIRCIKADTAYVTP